MSNVPPKRTSLRIRTGIGVEFIHRKMPGDAEMRYGALWGRLCYERALWKWHALVEEYFWRVYEHIQPERPTLTDLKHLRDPSAVRILTIVDFYYGYHKGLYTEEARDELCIDQLYILAKSNPKQSVATRATIQEILETEENETRNPHAKIGKNSPGGEIDAYTLTKNVIDSAYYCGLIDIIWPNGEIGGIRNAYGNEHLLIPTRELMRILENFGSLFLNLQRSNRSDNHND